MQYPFDVNEAIIWLGKMADLIFTFFDPIGQALCKRTLNLVERLNSAHAEKMRFYLSKADDVSNEADRQRVMMQIVQELCKRPGLNRTGFDMPTICIPDLNKQTRCVNQIEEVCQDIERTINHTIQNTLNTLERDCETVAQLLEKRLEQDTEDRNYNFKTTGRAMVFGALAVILPLLLVLNVLVSISSKSFLHALLGASFTDSLLVYLSPVRMLWSIVPDRFQWTVLLIIVIGSGGLFFLTKWSLGLRLTLSRRQKRQYLEMKEHVEEVVNAKKQQLYREYLGQSVGDHDL
ncbi:uncharacterized protein LOC110830705 isoform X1 [Zootermopsis nevadensis]|nr:uncharacterized protein LOC110830705 isoform X1 [Zootermopsis nevadensis]